MPKVFDIHKKLRDLLKDIKYKFYHLPEDSAKLKEFQNNKEKLENAWDSFKFQLENPDMLSPEEISDRAVELKEGIRNVNKGLNEINNPEKYRSYANKLERRKNLLAYIDNLKANKGIDGEKFNESDFNELEDAESENLRRDKIFWRNLGQAYNMNFERPINWEAKVEKIKKNIDERTRKLNEEHEEHIPVEENIYNNESFEKERENNVYVENEYLNKEDLPEYSEEEDLKYDVDEQPEEEIHFGQEEEEIIDEEQERELERENQEMERKIKEMEREKRRIEVMNKD